MEGIIKVTPEVLMSTAQEFEAEGTQIGGLTTQMMELVTGISGTWIGEASEAYMAKFSGLEDDIQRILNMVREHSEDLETMAQTYMTTESQAAEMAQSLASDVIV